MEHRAHSISFPARSGLLGSRRAALSGALRAQSLAWRPSRERCSDEPLTRDDWMDMEDVNRLTGDAVAEGTNVEEELEDLGPEPEGERICFLREGAYFWQWRDQVRPPTLRLSYSCCGFL